MLITQSFTLFVAIPIILLISINKSDMEERRKRALRLSVFFVSFFIATAFFMLFGDRIANILDGRDGSVVERFRVFLVGWELFKKFPIIGTGYGTFRAMDHLSGTLSYGGIIGTIMQFVFLKRLGAFADKERHAYILYCGYLCYIVTGCVGNSLYENFAFWIIPMLIVMLCNSNIEDDKNVYGNNKGDLSKRENA